MTTELITLSITETIPGTGGFSVIAMETGSQNIISLNLRKEQIISNQGEIFWDIGFITKVKDIRKNAVSYANPTYTATGTSIGANKINALKSIFEAKANSPQEFFDNEKLQFAIIKTTKVNDITVRQQDEVLKHYLSATVSCMPAYRNPMFFLNKDYRWINFWNFIYRSSEFENKKKKYLKLLNRKDKSQYFILYRHHFRENSNLWISGMHWL